MAITVVITETVLVVTHLLTVDFLTKTKKMMIMITSKSKLAVKSFPLAVKATKIKILI